MYAVASRRTFHVDGDGVPKMVALPSCMTNFANGVHPLYRLPFDSIARLLCGDPSNVLL